MMILQIQAYDSYRTISEPEFVNLLRSPGTYSKLDRIVSLESIPGLLQLLQTGSVLDTHTVI